MQSGSRRVLEWLGTAVVVLALLAFAQWMVPLAAAPFPGHGERFAAMAAAPFQFAGEFPHRVLWPTLAHVLGWCGVSPVGAARVSSGIMLWVVIRFARSRDLGPFDAVLAAAAVAASGPVLMYQTMACFSDPLNLALLVLQIRAAPHRAGFWALVLLAALSHELALFFAPWLLWLRRQHGARWLPEVLALAVVVLLYGVFRLYVNTHGGGSYGFTYYFENMIWVPWGLPALWALWLLVSLVEFGPLFACLGGSLIRPAADLGGRTGAWLYLACLLPLMVLAYDVMRFATFWMVPVLVGGIALLQLPRGRAAIVALLLLAVPCYLWQHPVPSQQGGAAFTELTGHVQALLPGALPMHAANGYAVTRELLVRGESIWLGGLAGLVAAAVAAALLARYLGAASTAGKAPRSRQNASP